LSATELGNKKDSKAELERLPLITRPPITSENRWRY